MSEIEEKPKTSKEAMTAIIVTGIVVIICILACTGVALAFILNAPW
jgi:flagellar basal body-associated protein FliL